MADSLWNYNPSNDDENGDDWNGENFSWFSRKRALPVSLPHFEQDAVSLDAGARILPAIVRPYAAKTAGIPVRFEYEMTTGEFVYTWADPGWSELLRPPPGGQPAIMVRETEIFLPARMTEGRVVVVRGLDGGDRYVYDRRRQTLFVVTAPGARPRVHEVRVSVEPGLGRRVFEVNGFWGDFGFGVWCVFGVVLAVMFGYATIFASWR